MFVAKRVLRRQRGGPVNAISLGFRSMTDVPPLFLADDAAMARVREAVHGLKPVVLYHWPCADGVFAALAARLACQPPSQEARFVPHAVFQPLDVDALGLTVWCAAILAAASLQSVSSPLRHCAVPICCTCNTQPTPPHPTLFPRALPPPPTAALSRGLHA